MGAKESFYLVEKLRLATKMSPSCLSSFKRSINTFTRFTDATSHNKLHCTKRNNVSVFAKKKNKDCVDIVTNNIL